ncbi:MAG: hypothetical protein WAW10_14500 [Gallionella sp.]
MRHKKLLVLIMCLLAAACLYLWLRAEGELSNFGLNAFTESLGILVTVLIVDYLIKRQEELRSLPQKATAYEDVRLLTSRVISFWSDVYHSCIPEESPKDVASLFCNAAFEKIRTSLNMDARPNVTPQRTWWEYFPQNLSDHRKRAETILERHNNVLDPKAYSYVHQIATEGMDPELINSIRQSDMQGGFPRPYILGSYYFLREGYFETVLGLVAWCEQQIVQLEGNGITGLRRVGATIGAWDRQDAPPSMISQHELLRQLAVVKEFQERAAAIDPK